MVFLKYYYYYYDNFFHHIIVLFGDCIEKILKKRRQWVLCTPSQPFNEQFIHQLCKDFTWGKCEFDLMKKVNVSALCKSFVVGIFIVFPLPLPSSLAPHFIRLFRHKWLFWINVTAHFILHPRSLMSLVEWNRNINGNKDCKMEIY